MLRVSELKILFNINISVLTIKGIDKITVAFKTVNMAIDFG